jgi:hypothetical protein
MNFCRIIRDDETLVSFVHVETKDQSKQVGAHTFSKRAEKFKQLSSTRKLMVAVF